MPFGQSIGPPPSADVAMQQQGQYAQAANRQGGLPPMGQAAPAGPDPSGPGAVEGSLKLVTIHLENAMKLEPALAPWLQKAIESIQTGLATVLGQQQQAGNPLMSASPPSEPGAGLPM